MLNWLLAVLFAAALISSGSFVASANCREDPRAIALDSTNHVRLKSYTCTVGDNTKARIRVEFHRIADPAAGLIAQGRSSEMLTKAFGRPLILENEVSKTYVGLLQRFGEARQVDGRAINNFGFRLVSADGLGAAGTSEEHMFGLEDVATGGPFKVLLPTIPAFVAGGPPAPYSEFYPAVDEIAAIKQQTIPDSAYIFYSTTCMNPQPTSSKQPETCKEYSEPKMLFWRGMQAEDVTEYPSNLSNYNRIVGHHNDVGAITFNSTKAPATLRLLHHIAGDGEWPQDFTVMVGALALNECGGLLQFAVLFRRIVLDVVTVENLSATPIAFDGFLGSSSKEKDLRATSTYATNQKIATGAVTTLAPGQKLLLATRINLLPSDDMKQFFSYPDRAEEIFNRIGSNGYSGDAEHGPPEFEDYEFGKSVRVSGVHINENPVDFQQKSANFVDSVLGWGMHSCPYLLSWDSVTGQWINHDKILHKAKTREQQYTETSIFAGLRRKFILEEREPETAFVDQALLSLALKNGHSITLQPTIATLRELDGNYVKLYWGDSVEFEFTLPAGIQEDDVAESRLMVTGYYEPYSNRRPQKGASLTLAPRSRLSYCPAK